MQGEEAGQGEDRGDGEQCGAATAAETGLIVGVVAAIVVIIGAGAFFVMRRPKAPPQSPDQN